MRSSNFRILIFLSWVCQTLAATPPPTLIEQTLTPANVARLTTAADKYLGIEMASYPQTYEDVVSYIAQCRKEGRAPRYYIDSRAAEGTSGEGKTWSSEAVRKAFAMSSVDMWRSRIAADELPIIALACRHTLEPKYCDAFKIRMRDYLRGSQLQRGGWDIPERKSAQSNYATWLATGTGLRAIVTGMAAMPPEKLDEPMIALVHAKLIAELTMLARDFSPAVLAPGEERTRQLALKQWFIRDGITQSNQWWVPLSGAVMAHWYLRTPTSNQQFQNFVQLLGRGLMTLGDAGENAEGLTYANFSLTEALTALYLLRASGTYDEFAVLATVEPKLSRVSLWLTHQIMPGLPLRHGIDSSDSFLASFILPSDHKARQPLDLLSALDMGRETANYTANRFYPTAEFTLAEYLNERSDRPVNPPLFGNYKVNGGFSWRSGWQDDANGFWIRGRSRVDSHTHSDCGHVSVFHKGKQVFREAGSLSYTEPLYSYQKSSTAHNTFIFGNLDQKDNISGVDLFPKLVWKSEDALEGRVELQNLGWCYIDETYDSRIGQNRWTRNVGWKADQIAVVDDIIPIANNPIRLFWHPPTSTAFSIPSQGLDVRAVPGGFVAGLMVSGARVTFWSSRAFKLSTAPSKPIVSLSQSILADGSVKYNTAAIIQVPAIEIIFEAPKPFESIKFVTTVGN